MRASSAMGGAIIREPPDLSTEAPCQLLRPLSRRASTARATLRRACQAAARDVPQGRGHDGVSAAARPPRPPTEGWLSRASRRPPGGGTPPSWSRTRPCTTSSFPSLSSRSSGKTRSGCRSPTSWSCRPSSEWRWSSSSSHRVISPTGWGTGSLCSWGRASGSPAGSPTPAAPASRRSSSPRSRSAPAAPSSPAPIARSSGCRSTRPAGAASTGAGTAVSAPPGRRARR